MKLFLLRHEKRPLNDPGFFTKLTHQGLDDTKKITEELKDKNIQIIFCSPFLRTIQTIQDFSINNNLMINIENSLYESSQGINFTNVSNYSFEDLNNDEYCLKNINYNYQGYLKIDDSSLPDTFEKVEKRIDNFINFLIEKYSNKDINILICSHQYILQYFQLKILNLNKKIDSNIIKSIDFDMGQIKQFNLKFN